MFLVYVEAPVHYLWYTSIIKINRFILHEYVTKDDVTGSDCMQICSVHYQYYNHTFIHGPSTFEIKKACHSLQQGIKYYIHHCLRTKAFNPSMQFYEQNSGHISLRSYDDDIKRGSYRMQTDYKLSTTMNLRTLLFLPGRSGSKVKPRTQYDYLERKYIFKSTNVVWIDE